MSQATHLLSIAAIPAQYPSLYSIEQLPSNQQTDQTSTPQSNVIPMPDTRSVGLSIQIPAIKSPEQADSDYLAALYREMEYYAQQLPRQAIEHLWLLGAGVKNLDPAELTQLCFRLNSLFQLATTNGSYGIAISQQQINPEALALLRGLQFQQLQLHFDTSLISDDSTGLNEIADNLELLNRFGFHDIYCTINIADCISVDALKKLLLGIQLYQPQQIELAGNSEIILDVDSALPAKQATLYTILTEFLEQRGYQPLGNHLFISASSPLKQQLEAEEISFQPWGFCAKKLADWIGLGVDACGHINNSFYRNSSDIEAYQEQINQQDHAQTWHGVLLEEQLQLHPIVQSLFCYGRIEGRDVERIPGQSRFIAESIIAQASEQLWLTSSGYTWELTATGRTHLKHLFQQLCLHQKPQQQWVNSL